MSEPSPHENRPGSWTEYGELQLVLAARPPRYIHGMLALLALLIVAAVTWACTTCVDLVVVARGHVRPISQQGRQPGESCEEAVVSPLYAGRILEVHAVEGARVRKNDVLVRLDTSRLTQEIAQRERIVNVGREKLVELDRLARLLEARYQEAHRKGTAEIESADEKVARTRDYRSSDIRLAQLELELAAAENEQMQALADKKAASQSELATAVARYRAAQARLQRAELPVLDDEPEVCRAALELLRRDYDVQLGQVRIQCRTQQAEIEAATLERSNLIYEREQSVLRAPSNGLVTSTHLKVGDFAAAGSPAVTIAEQQGFQIEVQVSSRDVGHLRVGQPARVKLDAFDYQEFGTALGTVTFIAPDSPPAPAGSNESTFAVRIALRDGDVGRGTRRGMIGLGMPGQAEIVTGQENLLWLLAKNFRQTVSLSP